MKKIYRISAFIASAALSLCLVSCGDIGSGSSSSEISGNALVEDSMGADVNVAADDMPFGATTTDLYPDDVPIAITYENRFMTADEAKKISDYISAVNSCDSELMKKTCYEAYLENVVQSYGNDDVQDYINSRHDDIESYTGEKFDIDYIIVNSLSDESADESETGFSKLDSRILAVAPEAEITERKMVGLEILYTTDSGSYSLSRRTDSDMYLYIYTIDGEIYIL